MSTPRQKDRDEAIARLREWLRPGDTLYTILRSVSRSGMSRSISVVVLQPDGSQLVDLHPNYLVSKATGMRLKTVPYDAIVMGGCGMDMGFALVYALGRVLFPEGFGCTGESCLSNDHANGDRNYAPHFAIGGCHEQVCYCHDEATWKAGGYANGCSTCGCHRIPHWHQDGGYALRQRWL